MRTRNSRSGDEIKTAKECNHNRVTRSDAKLKEAELKLKKDCELEKEKVVAEPISRETRSRSRGSKDEVVSETKNDKSKSFSSNLNISSTMEQMIDGFSVTSGPPNPIISKKSTVLSDELIISSPMASTSNSHDNNEIENNTKSSANTSKSSVLTADSIINDRDQQDKISCSGKIKILIAVTGSVASIKLIELISTLRSKFPILNHQTPITIDIKIIMTENAKHFTAPDKIFETFNNSIEVHDDKQEWNTWTKMGDEILHIELRKWADIFLIAPLDANTMGKMANGICDNLLTCTARAWDTSKPLIFCPAMNVHMYEHPMTKEHIYKLQSFGYIKIDCIAKRLACGDVGMGAMASVDTIVERLIQIITHRCNQRNSYGNKYWDLARRPISRFPFLLLSILFYLVIAMTL